MMEILIGSAFSSLLQTVRQTQPDTNFNREFIRRRWIHVEIVMHITNTNHKENQKEICKKLARIYTEWYD